MKKVTYFGLLLAVALTGLSSCSSSDDVTSDPTNPKSGESRLTLTISTPVAKTASAKGGSFVMGSRATDITTANKDVSVNVDRERTINRITVGIFSQNGDTVRTIKEFVARPKDKTASTGDGYFSDVTNSNDKTVDVITNTLKSKDTVVVAVNAPAGKFAGAATIAAFRARTEGIDTVLATKFGATSAEDSIVSNNIPMSGTAYLQPATTDGNFTATVPVYHQTAKVTLKSLSVDFKADGAYRDASFTLKNVYLINVPAALNFSDSAYANPTKEFFVGLDPENKKTGKVKNYLTSSEIKNDSKEDITLSGYTGKEGANTSLGRVYTFYTMPNRDSTKTNRTKLIIYGTFKANASDTGSDVYYPVPLNISYDDNGVENSTAPDGTNKPRGTVNPNKNYKCTVVIRSKGASSPDEDITPKQATITVKVQDFDNKDQTTVFN